ncbi:MAG: nucleotidyltransferase domain-containing protein [Bacteroidetes bacterium]|nr:nucleotidyltransferase domain-containing protein [Bacteroidota bacterium]
MITGIDAASTLAILDILRSHSGVEKAVLFGSRAMGTFTPESDIDICLFGSTLTLTDQARFAARFEELPLPQRVDVLRYHAITSAALRAHIDREGLLLYSANAQSAP